MARLSRSPGLDRRRSRRRPHPPIRGRLMANASDLGLRPRERAILVGIKGPRQTASELEEHLEELTRLTETAGGIAVGACVQERARRDPATAIGRGKVEEVRETARRLEAGLVIFDEDLTPAQGRNLERI